MNEEGKPFNPFVTFPPSYQVTTKQSGSLQESLPANTPIEQIPTAAAGSLFQNGGTIATTTTNSTTQTFSFNPASQQSATASVQQKTATSNPQPAVDYAPLLATVQAQLASEREEHAAKRQQLTQANQNLDATQKELNQSSYPYWSGALCGFANHIFRACGMPEKYSEPAWSLFAPIVSAAIDHQNGLSAGPILFRALESFIACRGTIDIGNLINAPDKILYLKNIVAGKTSTGDKDDENSEERDRSNDDGAVPKKIVMLQTPKKAEYPKK